jgi:hypothetical protein
MMYYHERNDHLEIPHFSEKRGRTRTDRFHKKERQPVDLAVVSLNTAGPVDGYSRQKMLFFQPQSEMIQYYNPYSAMGVVPM